MGAEKKHDSEKTIPQKILSVLFYLLLLYLFFLCIELIGGAFKVFGKEEATKLLSVTDNPMVGLVIGVLATSLMQSSSTTTTLVVSMVGSGALTVTQAVPMVMGANIGTTVTNTIISLGHVSRKKEFELAFSGAVVHDFFNLCTVAIFLPLEILFSPIEKTASFIADNLVGLEGAKFTSPIKYVVKPVVDLIIGASESLTDNKMIVAGVLLTLALGLLIFCLSQMVKIMRGAMAERLEVLVDKYLFTGTLRGLLIGLGVTAIVQSSSVTTSLVIPLIGAGIVRLEMVFPYMVGANIGTTVTALLASMATGEVAGVTIAICHLVFNLFGTAVFLPLRIVPITLAKKLGKLTSEYRWVALLYIVVVFFLIPGILIFLTR